MDTRSSFRDYLRKELLKRAKKNPRFSIRAFARQLAVEPSSLAQILAGKRKLTHKMCARLGERLGLSPLKMRSLLRESASSSPLFEKFNSLDEDVFQAIADWHYYAILELTRTDAFRGDLRWIARVLGISTAEAHAAIDRLKRLGYLTVDSDGRWIDRLGSATNAGNEFTAAAFREHQRQLLKKSIQALEDVPYEERVQSSMMLVGSRARIAEAKRRILHFIEELDEFLKTDRTKDEVYALSVSLFPLSRISMQPISEVSKKEIP